MVGSPAGTVRVFSTMGKTRTTVLWGARAARAARTKGAVGLLRTS